MNIIKIIITFPWYFPIFILQMKKCTRNKVNRNIESTSYGSLKCVLSTPIIVKSVPVTES